MRSRLIAAAAAVVLAVAGTVVLLSYVHAAGARAAAGAPATVPALVADAPIPLGTPAAALAKLVTTKAIPPGALLPNRITDIGQLAGQVALVALEPGEQLLISKFGPLAPNNATAATVPPTFQLVTILLRPEQALGGQLKAGDTVGVFISLKKPEPGLTHLTIQKVLVTAVQESVPPPSVTTAAEPTATPADSSPAAAASDGPAATAGPETSATTAAPDPTVNVLVTMATSAGNAEKIVFGAEHGSIWLSKEPLTANQSGTEIVDGSRVFG